MKFRFSSRKEWLNEHKYLDIDSAIDFGTHIRLSGYNTMEYSIIDGYKTGWCDIAGDLFYLDGYPENYNILKNKIDTILALEKLEKS